MKTICHRKHYTQWFTQNINITKLAIPTQEYGTNILNDHFLYTDFICRYLPPVNRMCYIYIYSKMFVYIHNYLHALVKKSISHRKEIWPVWSEYNIVIWLHLPLLDFVQVPVLSLRLFGCLMIPLRNLQHRPISARISIHPNSLSFYLHPKLKMLSSEHFFEKWKSFGFDKSERFHFFFFFFFFFLNIT